jgi:hypothetical protein
MDCKIVARPVFLMKYFFLKTTQTKQFTVENECLNCSVYRFNFERKIKWFFAVFMVTAKPLGRPSNFYI